MKTALRIPLSLALGGAFRLVAAPVPVAAKYFPNYHPTEPRNDKAHGKGWSEWEIVKAARPRLLRLAKWIGFRLGARFTLRRHAGKKCE